MGLINSYMSVFLAGTTFGLSAAYCIAKFLNKQTVPKAIPIEERFEFPEPEDEYRLILAIRSDLKMQKGKVAAQCGHASVAAYAKALKRDPEILKKWLTYGGTKIAVRVDSEEELMELRKSAENINLLCSIVRDAGHTQVASGSKTVIAIGPAPKSVLNEITGHLKLY